MEGGSSGGPSSWFDITKTKLALMSSLLGVGTIIYFTKNYLESGRFVPWRTSSTDLSRKSCTNGSQPKVIGGKRNVVIKTDKDAEGGITRKVMHRSRSRRSSVCSSVRRHRTSSNMSVTSSRSRPSQITRPNSFLDSMDINLNTAISELSNEVEGVKEVLGLNGDNDLNGYHSAREDLISSPLPGDRTSRMIEGEVEKLRRLLDFAHDVSMVTERTSDYVLQHQEVLDDFVPPPDFEPENYESIAENMLDFVHVDDLDYDSDTDSFISATESLDYDMLSDEEEAAHIASFGRNLKDLIAKHQQDDFYLQGIEFLTQYGVPVRTLRTDLLACDNDVDFCVKVHCLRTAFTNLLNDEHNKKWFVESGKEMLISLLKNADVDFHQFSVEFDRMITYCQDPDNWGDIDVELTSRGVCKLNFYDIVLDLLVMDSFQDLDAPPGAVTSAIQNRWLSNRIKYTALSTAIWTFLKAKKHSLTNQEGFFGIFYDISMHVTPLLAWGFLGPVQELNKLCFSFKDSMVSFLKDIFCAESVNYKSMQGLADDVLSIAKKRKEELMAAIGAR